MSVSLYSTSHLHQLEQQQRHHRHSNDALKNSSQHHCNDFKESIMSTSIDLLDTTSSHSTHKDDDDDDQPQSNCSLQQQPPQPPPQPDDKLDCKLEQETKVNCDLSQMINSDTVVNDSIQLDCLQSKTFEKDKRFLEMIKSRPKRGKKVISSRTKKVTISTDNDPAINNGKTQLTSNNKENIDLNIGLEAFFLSPSAQLGKKKFGSDDEQISDKQRIISRLACKRISLNLSSSQNLATNVKDESNKLDVDGQATVKQLSLSGKPDVKHDLVSRSKSLSSSSSSSSSIDPKKLLPIRDPRLSVSMIKELKSRQSTGNCHKLPNENKTGQPLIGEIKSHNLRSRTSKPLQDDLVVKNLGKTNVSSEKLSVKDKISAFGGQLAKVDKKVLPLNEKKKDLEKNEKSSQKNGKVLDGETKSEMIKDEDGKSRRISQSSECYKKDK